MNIVKPNGLTKVKTQRRLLLKSALSASIVAGLAPAVIPNSTRAAQKELRIMRWKNFVPAFEDWFNNVFVKRWGEENDAEVVIDNVGLGDINNLAEAEAMAQQGHDLVLFLAPRAALEDHVIDHREVYEECIHRYGATSDPVLRSCYNPRTGKYHGFCESYSPTLLTYRKDLWDAVGQTPDTWDAIRKGGRAIKLLHDNPVGISLASEHNCEHSMRAIMYSFSAAVQDINGDPAINSGKTLDAIKFVKALFEEAMIPDVLSWGASSNNQFMLSGTGNLTLDTMSVIRSAESKELPVNKHLALATLPEGPAGKIGPMFSANTYIIWRFAKSPELAKKFLVDYIGAFQEGFLASGFQNMPSFTGSVPNLAEAIASDVRYRVLSDVPNTLSNLGSPGYSNAATDEVLRDGIVSKMFRSAATGALAPQEALDQAAKAVQPIFDKWREAGKI